MQRKISFSKRTNLPSDPIDAVFQEIPQINKERAEKNLPPIISLCVGEPHLAINPASIHAVTHFLSESEAAYAFPYSQLEGRKETVEAIAKLYGDYYPQANYQTNEVMMCNGATQGLWNAFSLFVDEGDEVLGFEPFYSTYQVQVRQLGGTFIKMSTMENAFRPSAKILEETLQSHANAKLVIFNYPNNPTGIDLSYDELKAIAAVLQKYPQLVIVWDDVYRELTQNNHLTLLEVDPALKDRCIMINSGSKGLIGAPDMRIGMVGANADWIEKMVTLQANTVSSINFFSQLALTAVINRKLANDPDYIHWIHAAKAAYQQNIQFITNRLPSLGFKVVNGGHGFFLLLNASFLIGAEIPDDYLKQKIGHDNFETDTDVMLYFLHHAGVAFVPGSGFGIDEKLGYLRISCAKALNVLEMAVDKIKEALQAIPNLDASNRKEKPHFARFYQQKEAIQKQLPMSDQPSQYTYR